MLVHLTHAHTHQHTNTHMHEVHHSDRKRCGTDDSRHVQRSFTMSLPPTDPSDTSSVDSSSCDPWQQLSTSYIILAGSPDGADPACLDSGVQLRPKEKMSNSPRELESGISSQTTLLRRAPANCHSLSLSPPPLPPTQISLLSVLLCSWGARLRQIDNGPKTHARHGVSFLETPVGREMQSWEGKGISSR